MPVTAARLVHRDGPVGSPMRHYDTRRGQATTSRWRVGASTLRAWWARTRGEPCSRSRQRPLRLDGNLGDKKRDRRIGDTKADKKTAEEIARKANANLTLGTFEPERDPKRVLGVRDGPRVRQVPKRPDQPIEAQTAVGLLVL